MMLRALRCLILARRWSTTATPNRTNVEIVQRLPDDDAGRPHLRQRTWERGSGITQACGTGACAVAVAAILAKQIPGRQAIIDLDGGSLQIDWPSDGESVRMQGEAVIICEGFFCGLGFWGSCF